MDRGMNGLTKRRDEYADECFLHEYYDNLINTL